MKFRLKRRSYLYITVSTYIIISIIFISYSNLIKNKYEKLFNNTTFTLVDNIRTNSEMLAKQVDKVIFYKQITIEDSMNIRQISERLDNLYIQLSINYSAYQSYTDKKISNLSSDKFHKIENFSNQLERKVISSGNSAISLDKDSLAQLSKILKICNDINDIFYNYKKGLTSDAELKAILIRNDEWINILNYLTKVLNSTPL